MIKVTAAFSSAHHKAVKRRKRSFVIFSKKVGNGPETF